MFKKAKRIVSLLVAALLVASSLTVGFSAFAEEITTLDVKGTEAIMMGDIQVGTATHYEFQWNPQKNWEELNAMGSEGANLLTPITSESAIHTRNFDGSYTSTPSNSMTKLLLRLFIKEPINTMKTAILPTTATAPTNTNVKTATPSTSKWRTFSNAATT